MMKWIKIIFGPIGNKQFGKIAYIIMCSFTSLLSMLIWISTYWGDIVEIMVAILLPLIINVFFRSIYSRHFL